MKIDVKDVLAQLEVGEASDYAVAGELRILRQTAIFGMVFLVLGLREIAIRIGPQKETFWLGKPISRE